MEKPRMLKKQTEKVKESGCCFRSCGGAPVIQRDNSKEAFKKSKVREILKKIK